MKYMVDSRLLLWVKSQSSFEDFWTSLTLNSVLEKYNLDREFSLPGI